jgi:dephospho-CoA kinase
MTHRPTPHRIGLTGGIGSGKSTVGKILQARGAAIMDADAISRSLTSAHGLAMSDIAQVFGSAFVDSHGALNREHMRAHVFTHPHAKQTLEAIIHPLVAQEIQRQADVATNAGHHTLVFDVPLLVESGRWRSLVNHVLVVDCLVETQIQRVMARNAFDRDTVEKIIASQATRDQRLACADWVIYNDQLSLAALHELVAALALNAHL